ncbi:hypothetical protein [Caloranaerobacter azorensis]|uniref:Uncharacterized protein n=1 Tax=Caloranaerobacter azorensis TaxID=116090 RepID=A0A6P1YDK1_9FIRM|nr:hypothetical protein [Caloranaerobacter azorensis]QIB26066.1 hypothetical protein G3A45_01320 [Caloranaerobacter azorensis]
MQNLHAIAYAVLTYRRLEGQEYDEECFANVMEALMNNYTEDEVVKIVYGEEGKQCC